MVSTRVWFAHMAMRIEPRNAVLEAARECVMIKHRPDHSTIMWWIRKHGETNGKKQPGTKELLRCSKKEGNTDAKDLLIFSVKWFAPLKEGEFHSYIQWIGLRENFNRKPELFSHEIQGFPVKIFP